MGYQEDDRKRAWRIGLSITAAVLLLIIGSFAAVPPYLVWSKERSGLARLREAEWSRQIRVEEANAEMEAAKLLRQAEVERAHGAAEAIEIIGEGLRENEAYIRYLWIQGLHDGSSEVIYVPTEGNLPILEATRRFDLSSIQLPPAR